ncbi:hypothetical protein G8770_03705 [Aestuariicella hydrocarbonica]|uniref:Uncharacterized protein n=1 Tax=Pseudomaricurvus hydrocarbonicus TaxID=1470433 RepID=A0A9E5JSK3_9GAMM|nr:hypothetical protein [Aestuariicella hydrocarbonica]NHO64651.1 hypothetical protein [Aestuariicella hydrocarbonica]
MSEPGFSDLLDIVGDLKDQLYTLDHKLEATREQVALLTEALDQQTPKAITSANTNALELTRSENA